MTYHLLINGSLAQVYLLHRVSIDRWQWIDGEKALMAHPLSFKSAMKWGEVLCMSEDWRCLEVKTRGEALRLLWDPPKNLLPPVA